MKRRYKIFCSDANLIKVTMQVETLFIIFLVRKNFSIYGKNNIVVVIDFISCWIFFFFKSKSSFAGDDWKKQWKVSLRFPNKFYSKVNFWNESFLILKYGFTSSSQWAIICKFMSQNLFGYTVDILHNDITRSICREIYLC